MRSITITTAAPRAELCFLAAISFVTAASLLLPTSARGQDVSRVRGEDHTTSRRSVDQVWYVSPTGDDRNPGTIDEPFLTIQRGVNEIPDDGMGGTVFVRDGTYPEQVVIDASGTPGAEVILRNFPGETPLIDGTEVPDSTVWGGLIQVFENDHIIIEGFEIQNSPIAGIRVAQSDHVTVRGNKTRNTVESGIGIWHSTNARVLDNEIRVAVNGGGQECLTVASVDSFLVSGNYVTEPSQSTNAGIDVKGGSSHGLVIGNFVDDIPRNGIYLDAYSDTLHHVDVIGNVSRHCANGITLSAEQDTGRLHDIRVMNNISYDNYQAWPGQGHGNGILFSVLGTGSEHHMYNLWIVNNTCHGNEEAGINLHENEHRGAVVLRNNILAENGAGQILCPGSTLQDLIVDHNLSFGVQGTDEALGDDHLWADPLFADAAGADFHLRSGSPAIDAGNAAGAPATDLDGQDRPCGRAVDLGAYERCLRAPPIVMPYGR